MGDELLPAAARLTAARARARGPGRTLQQVTLWIAGRGRWATAYATVALTSAWSTRSFWWPGRYVVSFDGYAYSGPNLTVTEAALRRWSLALWNDSIFGGVSHLGNPQAGTLYPPRLLTLLFEENRAMGVLVALHVVLLGTGMVWLARRLGFDAVAAAVAGCALVLSGMTLTKAIQFEQILVLAWMPWLVAAIHATLRCPRPWRAAGGLAIVTAAMLTAGHPQMSFEAIVLAGAAVVGFVDVAAPRRLLHLATGAVLGALVALPQLIAAAIATRQSAITTGRDPALLVDPRYSMVPSSAVRALLGSITAPDPAALAGASEGISFVGVVVVVLAVVGVVDGLGRRDRRQWTIALSLCATVCALWSTGSRSVLFRAARRLVPGFDLARVSSRWLIVVVIILVVLAAAGLDALLRGVVSRRTYAISAGIIVACGLFVVAQRIADGEVVAQWALIALLALGALAVAVLAGPDARRGGAAALAVAVLVELGLMSLHSLPQLAAADTPFTSPAYRTTTTDWLQARAGYVISFTDDGQGPAYSVPGLRPNANVLAGIRSVDGYDGGVWITKRWADALRRLSPDPSLDLPLRNAVPLPLDPVVLGRLGVRYVLVDRSRPTGKMTADWIGPVAEDDRFVVYENPEWRAEAIAWPSARAVPRDSIPELLGPKAAEHQDTLFVTSEADQLDCAGVCSPIGFPVERHSPEHVTVAVDVPAPAIVTLDQQYDPGWQVTVDGDRTDLIEADGLVVGVRVEPGDHRIEWRYHPWWLRPALAVSLVAAVAAVALAVGRGFRQAARSRPA